MTKKIILVPLFAAFIFASTLCASTDPELTVDLALPDIINSESTVDNDVTRANTPYLRLRSSVGFSDTSNTSDRLRVLAWHPTAPIFAAAGGPCTTTAELDLYNVIGTPTGAYLQDFPSLQFDNGYQINTINWSSDGSYLALGGSGITTNQFKLYSYAPSNSALSQIYTLSWGSSTSSSINSIAIHPSGKYIAIGGTNQTNGYSVIVYYLDLITPLMTPLAQLNLGSSAVVNALSWDATGTYLAVGCKNESTGKATLQTYKFITTNTSGNFFFSLNQISTADFGGSAAYVLALAWSPDNTMLVAGGYSGGAPYGTVADDNEIKLYTVSNGILTNAPTGNIDFGPTMYSAYVSTLAWDPQQQYLIAGGFQPQADSSIPNPRQFNMYIVNGSSLTPKQGSQNTYGTNTASYVSSVAWQPARTFMAVGGYKPLNGNEIWLMQFMDYTPAL